ncbi:MAG: branched-chain amino acid ABC transporter permease [Candidatus Bathyarchaeota archaeon]|nr:branched-chain amino acid ABC transporter permease [Candidatus Bathyarchaeota archaeon]
MDIKKTLTSLLRKRPFQFLLVGFVILVLLPVLITDNFFLYVLTLICISAIYAASWNFLANSGQGSLGHAAFLGLGGFASALLGNSIATALIRLLGTTGMPIGALSVTIQILVLLVGGLLSAGIGLLIGLACVRLKAWYLAMVTFGFSVIAHTLSSQFDAITNGVNGFAPTTLVPRGFPFYILVISFMFSSISIMYLIMKSRMGLAFRAIHGNEAEAKMIGINTAKYKLIAFVISTFFAGIAGGLNVYFLRFVDNSIFAPANSFLPLIMSVIGGLGTVAGPIIGSIFWVSIQQILALPSVVNSLQASVGQYFPGISNVGPPISLIAIGVILVIIVIFEPKGLVSLFRKIYKRLGVETHEKAEEKKKRKNSVSLFRNFYKQLLGAKATEKGEIKK